MSSDGPLGRLKERVRSIDDHADGGSIARRLSGKMPGRRRRRRSAQKDALDPSRSMTLPAAAAAAAASPEASENRYGSTRSEDSLGRAESISSSLLTEDSDPAQ
ncbi:MAG: hypothetical protein INR71_11960 [Terriglobus roseus]|nr:hypothetical protein [Terriglobus roseus]